MELVRIFALKSEKDGILKTLQGMAAFDVSAADNSKHNGFWREKYAASVEENRKNALLASNALDIINRVYPEKKSLLASFSGRRQISADEFFAVSKKAEENLEICHQVLELERKIAEIKAEKVRLNTSIEQLSPWENTDVPMSITQTEKTAVFFGSIMGTLTLETLCEKIAQVNPEIQIYSEIQGYAAGRTLICAICRKADSQKALETLRMLDFALETQSSEDIPSVKIKELRQQLVELDNEISNSVSKITELSKHRSQIEITADWYLSAAELYETKQSIDNSKHTVLITGYVTSCDLPLVREKLEKEFTVHIENEAANPDEAPVRLKNNKFSEPAESITSMYALPSAADIDPTPVTSFFYYLFFGMMLSDAGYGILMWIATWAVNKFLNPEDSMRKNMKLFMYCGISTTFWGFFFGSFFGIDIISIIYRAITGSGLPFKYPFINPLEGDAMAMLILSVGLGLVQIIAGLCVKFYITAKADGVLDAVLDTGLWIMTLLGFAVMGVGLLGFKTLQTVGLAIAGACLLGIAVTGGRKKKGAMKFLGGLASLYDITGYVSDLLSFSRLMALGLTTAAMSMVFNKLGLMVSGGIIGKVFMVAILIVGHAVNFGLNALGAYVHTLRLQYVELFSKFYDGGGRPFKPFAFKGKYIRIKEEK